MDLLRLGSLREKVLEARCAPPTPVPAAANIPCANRALAADGGQGAGLEGVGNEGGDGLRVGPLDGVHEDSRPAVPHLLGLGLVVLVLVVLVVLALALLHVVQVVLKHLL